jgi:hypothetical protein
MDTSRRSRVILRVAMKRLPATPYLALGGIVGPWLWTTIVVLLTVLEYDTLTAFGWSPADANGVQFPSSLVLGPLGWVQSANSALLGLLIIGLAAGIYREVRPRLRARIGPVLLGIAGVGAVLGAFPTDHGPPNAPTTWHGVIHNVGFAVFSLSVLLSFVFLTASFWGDSRWRSPRWLAPMVGIAAVGILVLAGLVPIIGQFGPFVLIFLGITLFGLRLRAFRRVPEVESGHPAGAT